MLSNKHWGGWAVSFKQALQATDVSGFLHVTCTSGTFDLRLNYIRLFIPFATKNGLMSMLCYHLGVQKGHNVKSMFFASINKKPILKQC